MHRTLGLAISNVVVSAIFFAGFYLFYPPPRHARAEAGVFNLANYQKSVTSAGIVTVPSRNGRFDASIEQTSATADVYCGSPKAAAVSTSNGMLLPAGKGNNLTLNTSAEIDCISAGGTVTVTVTETW